MTELHVFPISGEISLATNHLNISVESAHDACSKRFT